jgi:hypothetical protein
MESRARAMKVIEEEFGGGAGDERKKVLREIFDGVRSGKLKFEEFEKAVKELS